jgi:hypothetical protein
VQHELSRALVVLIDKAGSPSARETGAGGEGQP